MDQGLPPAKFDLLLDFDELVLRASPQQHFCTGLGQPDGQGFTDPARRFCPSSNMSSRKKPM